MQLELVRSIASSISLVMLLAYLLTQVPFVQRFVSTESPTRRSQLLLAGIFGLLGIISTCTGTAVQGAIANTRVIAVMAGGILGGPVVGISAGLIAGTHRLLIDIGGFTSVACTVSTVLEGLIAGVFSETLRKHRHNGVLLFSVTFLAELVQMATILLLAKPFYHALQLVQVIFLPMTFLNSMGVTVFIRIFESVFREQDRASGNRVQLALELADQSLPYLRHGLRSTLGLHAVTTMISQRSDAVGVMMTNHQQVLSCSGELMALAPYSTLPQIVRQTLSDGQPHHMEAFLLDDPFALCNHNRLALCAPLTQTDGRIVGTLLLLFPRYHATQEANFVFVRGLASLFSTQLALSQMEYQRKLLTRAEYNALQSQINPHFLFNALSTITAFCREKPDHARELLLTLAQYFRGTLRSSDSFVTLRQELEHVNCYLELEKARFEEKLQVSWDVPSALLEYAVPVLILQPLVENAVKHGAMRSRSGTGYIRICARVLGDTLYLSVRDNGPGISADILRQLYTNQIPSQSVGLSNVHKRLCSLYGKQNGLRIHSSPRGTRVVLPLSCKTPHTFEEMML